MHFPCTYSLLIALLCAVSFSPVAEANFGHHHYHYYEEPKCVFYPDYSTVESSLRSAIFTAETEKAAAILTSRELFSLGAGFQFRPNETCLLVQSEDRANDPDIVAAHALALNAEKTSETEKLARAIVLSFEADCQCSLYTIQEKEQMTAAFKATLDDPEERRLILEFGSNQTQHVDSSSVTGHYGKRRLMQRRNHNSVVCYNCDPPNLCNEKGVRGCTTESQGRGRRRRGGRGL